MRRRTVLAAGALGSAALTAAWMRGNGDVPAVLPSAPPGDERLEKRYSAARRREVDFWTAVPAGHGDGRGLPVCVILHGGSKRPADFSRLGLGGFLTACVRRTAAPFVLAGATGDRLAWQPHDGDDPQRMVHEEVPKWCSERGFDTRRIAAWGWSMGGYGALLLATTFPGFVRSVAAFSPAVSPGDPVFSTVGKLAGVPVGLWCGRDDDLLPDVRDLQQALPAPPVIASYTDGRHHFAYWSRQIPAAFDFLAGTLRR